jgi:DsbC/DsbD-like thiol-disulfide interchange protein
MTIRNLLLALAVSSTGGALQAQVPAGGEQPVQATLVADTTAVAAGQPFRLGVLFKMQPGWHIYWKNPGETGFATSVQWVLSEGITASEVQYPAPWFFESPGPLGSFGYEHDTLLFSSVQVGSIPEGKTELEFSAKARWLMCSDRCIPGNETVMLKMPVGPPQPANRELFDKAAAQVPKTTTVPGLKTSLTKSGNDYLASVSLDAQGKQLVAADKDPNERRFYFYPDKVDGYVVGIPEVKGGTQPTIIVKLSPSSAATPAPIVVSGVVTYQEAGAEPVIARVEVK